MAEDLLFATLDPTMRSIFLPGVEKAILSDTVGFISDLPTAAGRGVPRDARGSNRGRCDPPRARHRQSSAASPGSAMVLGVLEELGVIDGEDRHSETLPILELWNKWDLLDDERRAELEPLAAADERCPAAVCGDRVGRRRRCSSGSARFSTKGAQAALDHAAGERRAADRLAALARRSARRGGSGRGRAGAVAADRGAADRQGIRPLRSAGRLSMTLRPGAVTGYETQFDFPSREAPPELIYLLASVPRSGSTYVSHLLWARDASAHR